VTSGAQTLRPRQLFALAFGTVVGITWVFLGGTWLRSAGPVGTSIGIILGGLSMIPVLSCYIALSKRHPGPGGEIHYATLELGPRTGFFCGWLLVLAYIATVAFHHPTVAWLVQIMVSGASTTASLDSRGISTGNVLATIGLLAVTAANMAGARAATRFQDASVLCLIIVSSALVVLAIYIGHAENLRPAFGNVGSIGVGIGSVIAVAPFLYAGFNTAVQAAWALDAPSRRGITRALYGALAAGALFYVAVVFCIALPLPRITLLALPLPSIDVFGEALHSQTASTLVASVGLLALLTSWNGVFFAATRVLTRLFANVAWVQNWSERRRSVTFSAMTAALSVLIIIPGRTAIGLVISGVALLFTFVFFITCLAQAASLRRRLVNSALRYAMPLAGILVCVIDFALGIWQLHRSPMATASAVGLTIWVLSGYMISAWAGRVPNVVAA
jgi:amino acid transporter